MATRKVCMSKIRDVLRLSQGVSSERAIHELTGVSRSAVRRILERLRQSALSPQDALTLNDRELQNLIYPTSRTKEAPRRSILEGLIPSIVENITTLKHETLEHQWMLYREKEPSGYSYSQFCYWIQQAIKAAPEATAVLTHAYGDLLYVDFAGDPLYFTGLDGIKTAVKVFVAVLPASRYIFAGCAMQETTEQWIRLSTEALHFFGGAPNGIVPDCAKAVVSKAHLYESEKNPQYAQFADYYRTVIIPARPGHPRDKALVENSVNNLYRWVYPRVAHLKCRSFDELCHAVSGLTVQYNERVMKSFGMSRRQLFETHEKPSLKPLPAQKFVYKSYQPARKIGTTSHIYLKEDRHYYSVPEKYVGRMCELYYTGTSVEIHCENERIWTHPRDRAPHQYTTIPEHVPTRLRFFMTWTPQKAKESLSHVGNSALQMVDVIFSHSPHPLQGMKSLWGLVGLARKYPAQRLELACARAIRFGLDTTSKVENILLSRSEARDDDQMSLNETLPLHPNIRYTISQGVSHE